MSYFVTGGTGFLGRYLIGNLLKRKGTTQDAAQQQYIDLVKKLKG